LTNSPIRQLNKVMALALTMSTNTTSSGQLLLTLIRTAKFILAAINIPFLPEVTPRSRTTLPMHILNNNMRRHSSNTPPPNNNPHRTSSSTRRTNLNIPSTRNSTRNKTLGSNTHPARRTPATTNIPMTTKRHTEVQLQSELALCSLRTDRQAAEALTSHRLIPSTERLLHANRCSQHPSQDGFCFILCLLRTLPGVGWYF